MIITILALVLCTGMDQVDGHPDLRASSDDMLAEHYYDIPEGEDYLAIYETIDRKRQEAKEFKVRNLNSKVSRPGKILIKFLPPVKMLLIYAKKMTHANFQ